jgi:hypothetical protein
LEHRTSHSAISCSSRRQLTEWTGSDVHGLVDEVPLPPAVLAPWLETVTRGGSTAEGNERLRPSAGAARLERLWHGSIISPTTDTSRALWAAWDSNPDRAD